jgi:hypothetical protein
VPMLLDMMRLDTIMTWLGAMNVSLLHDQKILRGHLKH